MGTYTTNYQLFMPSIGEQGWGELVNGNFTTIDTTLKGLDTRLTTCESTDVAYNTRLETLEAGNFETINAGTINAEIINGTVYHEFVKTKPYPWAAQITLLSGSASSDRSIGVGTYTISFSSSIDLNQFKGITAIDNSLMVTYSLNASGTAYAGPITTTLTTTDITTNQTTTKSYSGAFNTTFQSPVLATISVSCTGSVGSHGYYFSVGMSTSETVYLK